MCDAFVHSANPLALRQERIRLKTASSSSVPSPLALKSNHDAAPAWHQGFKRKASTLRPKPSGTHAAVKSSEALVPDLKAALADETSVEEQLLYNVSIFDPALAEFCSPPAPSLDDTFAEDAKPSALQPLCCTHTSFVAATATASTDAFAGFLPSDMELAQIAADMETLLGRGLDGDSFCMDGLGLVDSRCSNDASCCPTDTSHVKTEMDEDAANMLRSNLEHVLAAQQQEDGAQIPVAEDEEGRRWPERRRSPMRSRAWVAVELVPAACRYANF